MRLPMDERELDFQLLFEESPDILLVLLPDAPRYTMVAATRARLEATLLSREQTIGRGLFEVFPDNPDDLEATGTRNLRMSLDRVLQKRVPDTMAVQKYDIRGPDGTFQRKFWSPKNLPVLSASGKVVYILHRVEDVTDLVRATELGDELRGRTRAMEREVIARSQELAAANSELRAANSKLGELDAAKTAFFSNVSHEFRTPLTLMLGPLEDSLADTSINPLQRERLELAYNNALRLLKLVNTLLDFSRIEAGRLQATYAPLDVAEVTRELAGMFQSAASKAGIEYVIECPSVAEPAWLDRDMWEKIVTNLISNALKYTHAGSISVRLTETEASFVLTVSDTGVGIPQSELPRIFERFYRVSSTGGRTHEGAGIGLSLVNELVRLHGGNVTAESVTGTGTTFRVQIPKGSGHLPTEAISEPPADRSLNRDTAAHVIDVERWNVDSAIGTARAIDAPYGASPDRASILVVDDNADLRLYVSRLLSPAYDVMTANDGVEALQATRTRKPDIVLSDVMMPRLDGLSLLRELRRNPETAFVPVILLSARAGEESAIEGLDSGADDYLMKPFSARELVARVRTHVALARMRRDWITELERANHDLDAFSYSVSHDLRAPLRAIDGFSRILRKNYLTVIDDRGQHYLANIMIAVTQMSAMIESMLKLAQIGRAAIRAETVELSALAFSIVSDLRQANPDRAVSVAIEADLAGHGDPDLLRIVLANLIGNAWKFTAQAPEARIEFGRNPEDGSFFVRDNGAGFDMAYATRLFAPFQRLHRADEFEGTGVGLATVQRVVQRHGGRIWVQASQGEGATFFFSLPRKTT
jgi:signal transduction histidine kinase